MVRENSSYVLYKIFFYLPSMLNFFSPCVYINLPSIADILRILKLPLLVFNTLIVLYKGTVMILKDSDNLSISSLIPS